MELERIHAILGFHYQLTMEYANLKGRVAAVIKENGNMEITGDLLQGVLLDIISSIGTGFQFVGVANPSTNPGTPDAKVFYLAFEPGTYINFGGAVLTSGIGVFSFDSAWHYASIDIPSRSDIETAFDGKMNKITADAEIALKADSINPVMPPMVTGSARGVLGRSAAARFLYRQISSGSGAAWLRSIHGRTVSYNQLVQNGDFSDGTTRWTGVGGTIAVTNKVATFTAGASVVDTSRIQCSLSTIAGHKYRVRVIIQGSVSESMRIKFSNSPQIALAYNAGVKTTVEGIITEGNTVSTLLYLYPNNTGTMVQGDTCNFYTVEVTDLTQEGLDSIITTPEQFEAWQMEWFGHKGYLGYTPGTLVNVNPTGVLTTGRNVWDEEWEVGTYNSTTGEKQAYALAIRCTNFIRVHPNTQYYLQSPATAQPFGRVLFYDADYGYIGSWLVDIPANRQWMTPANCSYVTFYLTAPYGTTYKHDICINISDPAFNGQYEPYNGHTLPLDFTEHFATGVNGLNGIYDEVVSDENGKFTDGEKRFGIVDLWTLDWVANTNYGFQADTLRWQIKRPATIYEVGNIICSIRKTMSHSTVFGQGTSGIGIAVTNIGIISINSAIADVNAFKADLQAKDAKLVYELATPQHVTFTDPSDAVYPVTEGGTEQVLPVNGKVPTTISPDMTLQMPRILGKEVPTMATLDNFLAAIGPKIGKTITKEWDPETRSYQFDIQ